MGGEAGRWVLTAALAFGGLQVLAIEGQAQQFRGDASHTGVASTEGIDAFGGVAWQFKTGGSVRSSATLSGGVLFVGSSDGKLYAIEAETGDLAWSFDAGFPIGSTPAVVDGMVLFGSREGTLHGVSARDGSSRWRFEAGQELPLPWGREGWDYIQGSVAIANGLAYWGGGDGVLYAVDPATGREHWRVETGARLRSTPAVAEGLLVIGNADGLVLGLDAATGEERWRFATAGTELNSADAGFDRRQISASPAILDGVVYLGSRDASLYALDLRTGEELWRFGEESAWIISSAAVTADRVFSARSSSRRIRAIERASGEEVWAVQAAGSVFSSPVVVGNTLYVGNGSGEIAAYDADTGEARWTYRTGGGIWSTPLVHDRRLYVGSDDGYVYALAAANGPPVRRAVFFDEGLMPLSSFGAAESHTGARDYFVEMGYELLDGQALPRFLESRLADQAPSVVVFAMDALPETVTSASGGAPLLRQYLEAGGKVVWMGSLPTYLERDASTGQIINANLTQPEDLLDVDLGAFFGDIYQIDPTETGERWGLSSAWIGQGHANPSEVSLVLASDELGRAAAWVKSFGGPTGTGYVQVRPATSNTILAEIQRVAEYGLAGVRRAH